MNHALNPSTAALTSAFEQVSPTTRILFLDFDGPLHPASLVAALNGAIPPSPAQWARDNGLFCYLKYLVALLAEHPDVILIVHSSWRRYLKNPEIRELLGDLAVYFAGVTELSLSRYDSIQFTAERYGATDVLILDDDPSEFPADCKELVVCDPELGLSDERTQERIRQWLLLTAAQAC